MSRSIEEQLVARWRDIADRNREVLAIWRDSDFRLRVGGIDITEAEIASAQARVAHLDNMIALLDKARGEPSDA